MIKLSDQDAAILGLLYEHHHYASRIVDIMEKRSMSNFIKIEFSSIYYVLKRLEEKGLVDVRLRKLKNNSSRKVYYITDNGKLAMEEKIKHILSVNKKQISSFDLAIANIHILTYNEIIECLESYLKSTDDRIKLLEESILKQKNINPSPTVIALFSHPLVHLKAEKKWIYEFINLLTEEKLK